MIKIMIYIYISIHGDTKSLIPSRISETTSDIAKSFKPGISSVLSMKPTLVVWSKCRLTKYKNTDVTLYATVFRKS